MTVADLNEQDLCNMEQNVHSNIIKQINFKT